MPYLSAQAVAANENAGFVDFVIRLDAAVLNEVRVNFSVEGGTATHGSDFRGYGGTLVFAAGETSKTLRVDVLNDTTAEPTEVFWLDLAAVSNVVVPQRWTPALIFDNDAAAGIPAISVSDRVVDERSGRADFFVALNRPSATPVTVSYATADGTAAAGQDFAAAAGLLTFAPGETVKTVSVTITDDALDERDEFFSLVLSNASAATLADAQGVATIARSDSPPVAQPYVFASALAASEGETFATYLVQLSAASANEVRVNYSVESGTATHGPDFRGYGGTLVFAPGETVKTLPVPLINDTTAEPTEVFWLDLAAVANVVVPQRWTPALIVDDDATAGTPAVSVSDVVVDEADQTARFFVMLDRPSTGTVGMSYATADDSAAAGSDYVASTGTLSFAPGETVKTVAVDLVDDPLAEGDEFFSLMLSGASGVTLADPQGVATIARSDSPPVSQPYVFATTLAASEGETLASYVVQLSAASANEVRVNYSIESGTATHGPDFRGYGGTLVFAPGETAKTLPVPLINDTTAEPTEVFWLDLAAVANVVVPQRWTPALIVDNDATAGTPAVSVSDVVVDEADQTARFFVTLDRPSTGTVGVAYATADDSAAAGSDYVASTGTLSFAPGETVKTVVVKLLDDALAESDERFQLRLSNPTGATVGDGVGAALIGRNDTPPIAGPQVLASPITVSEGDTFANFLVRLSAPTGVEVRVNYGVDSSSATHGPDFRGYGGTLVFAPGETVKVLPVPLIDDTSAEGIEIFNLDLGGPVNATVPQRFTAATLLDNDSPGLLQSRGISNDLYTVTGALDRIAESPGGGIDTVRAGFSYTLPDNVENLVLTGSALNAIGNAGNNILRGTAANNVLDGKDGIDTAVFGGPLANYTVAGSTAQRTVASAAEGSDTLFSVERLQFADTILAADTAPGGNVWGAWAMWNAAFNVAPDTQQLSQWTAELDRFGGNLRDLAQAMINFYAPGVPDEVLVAYLWSTIVGGEIPLDALATYVGLVGNGTFTQASLLEFVTTFELNTAEIVGIVGQTLPLDPAYFPALS